MNAELRTHGLSVSYGGVAALSDVDIDVRPGQLVGLIGPNGAGKTTLIDTLSGFVRPTRGRVELAGRDISRLPVHRRARLGLGRTFQSIESFEPLTVRGNVRTAAEARRSRRSEDIEEKVDAAIHQLGLDDVADEFVSELSYGLQKLAGLAMTLVREPSIVLLDEPAAGLDAVSVEAVTAQLRRACEDGVGVLMVDHDMDVVFGLCDDVYVLDFGRIIAHGPPAEIRVNEDVRTAYLGPVE